MLNNYNSAGKRNTTFITAAAAAALVLAGCGASVSDGAEPAADQRGGFAYGADQQTVDSLIEGLDPVTITFQTDAASPESVDAQPTFLWKEEIERRSNGQITVDVAWGQSIAGFTEVEDALIDGRMDLAIMIFAYEPEDYPAFDSFSMLSSAIPSTPLAGELISSGAGSEFGWSTPALVDEITAKGLIPMSTFSGTGDWYTLCNSENSGSDVADWEGRQIRVGTSAHHRVIAEAGATPVSMEMTETFEALSRNTVDCTMMQAPLAVTFGLTEVAPNVSFLGESETSYSGRFSAGLVAGPQFADLPLAYQQIIFDASPANQAGHLEKTVKAGADLVDMALEAGGRIQPLPEEFKENLARSQAEMVKEASSSGVLGDEPAKRMQELVEKWEGIVEEMGYVDGGDLSTMGEWYSNGEFDYREFADRVFEETHLDHRPE